MPSIRLDASWEYVMNEAVARHLSFGKDIIFTYGPYASVSTVSYDPATARMMMGGSLFLGICYAVLFLTLARKARVWLVLAFLAYLAAFLYSREALLFSYPVLLVFCAIRFAEKEDNAFSLPALIWTALAVAPLGLLPLIKGTYLILAGITYAGLFVYLLCRRRLVAAFTVLLCPPAACIGFWSLSGQAIGNLPRFFASLAPIVSGYTEAMGSNLGSNMEIAAYLAAAAAILVSIVTTQVIRGRARVVLFSYMGCALFLVFKGGFVRHDSHASIAGCFIVLAALISGLLFFDSKLVVALFLSLLTFLFIAEIHSVNSVLDNLRRVYLDPWSRCFPLSRDAPSIALEYDRSLMNIRRKAPVPQLQGSVDIYPTDQSAILASGNRWNPRPMFQSYSAYVPSLLEINARHLRGDDAPDNVLFSIQPIDERLPSLEDGLSWAALLDNYTLTGFGKDLASLRRNPSIRSAGKFTAVDDAACQTGKPVAIPQSDSPLFARIDLRPTLLGKIVGAAFKYPKLAITVKLANGSARTYRVVANMMRTDFLLSPLVENTADFAALMRADGAHLRSNKVESMMITSESGGGLLWEGTYSLKLQAYGY